MTLQDQITDANRLIRACQQMRENVTDPAQIEIIRVCTNRAVDRLHDLLRTMETEELFKMTGIYELARSIATQDAMTRALEAMPTSETVATEKIT